MCTAHIKLRQVLNFDLSYCWVRVQLLWCLAVVNYSLHLAVYPAIRGTVYDFHASQSLPSIYVFHRWCSSNQQPKKNDALILINQFHEIIPQIKLKKKTHSNFWYCSWWWWPMHHTVVIIRFAFIIVILARLGFHVGS